MARATSTATSLFYPSDVALDSKGNLYISDGLNGRLRMVNASGIISTVAGGGTSLLDGGALQESLAPTGITLDASGNLLVVELNLRRVRRVVLAQESITTVAGQLPTPNAGDNIPATSTPLLSPVGVALDSTGNVYVSDYTDQRIRRIAPSGIISTIAGNGIPGYTKSGQASAAEIGGPLGMNFDSQGDLYFISGVGPPDTAATTVRRRRPNCSGRPTQWSTPPATSISPTGAIASSAW